MSDVSDVCSVVDVVVVTVAVVVVAVVVSVVVLTIKTFLLGAVISMEEPDARVTVKSVLLTTILSTAALVPETLTVMPFTENTVSVVSATSLYAAKANTGARRNAAIVAIPHEIEAVYISRGKPARVSVRVICYLSLLELLNDTTLIVLPRS